jgi:hypothetical protein
MRLAIAQPCLGSSEIVLRIRRSRVPWTRSLGLPIFQMIYNTLAVVDSQGMWVLASSSRRNSRIRPYAAAGGGIRFFRRTGIEYANHTGPGGFPGITSHRFRKNCSSPHKERKSTAGCTILCRWVVSAGSFRAGACYLAFLFAAWAAAFNSLLAWSSRSFAFCAWPCMSHSLAF